MSLEAKAAKIRAVILDVDGVLTDGRIGYAGDDEVKFFDVKDGHGIKLLRRAGLRVGMFSGRGSDANLRRARELSLDFVYQNEKDKRAAFERLLAEQELEADECLYIGDDVVDIPCMRRAGIGVAVADAVPEVKEAADRTTDNRGGRGAVREVAMWLLRLQNKYDTLMARYLD